MLFGGFLISNYLKTNFVRLIFNLVTFSTDTQLCIKIVDFGLMYAKIGVFLQIN